MIKLRIGVVALLTTLSLVAADPAQAAEATSSGTNGWWCRLMNLC